MSSSRAATLEGVTEHLEPGGVRPAAVRRFRLELLDRPQAEPFDSVGARTLVGSHPRAHLRLVDSAVSRFHFEVVLCEGTARVVDLDSRNGTFVDGLRVFDAALPPCAMLSAGRTRLRFTLRAGHVEIPISRSERFGDMVGRSSPMRAAFAALRAASLRDEPLVIEGERGVGKSLAGQAVHEEGPRAEGPLQVVDCEAGFDLLDVTSARGGTLLIRRVELLQRSNQRELARALRSRALDRSRLVATTQEPLGITLNAGRFHADLFDILSVTTVRLPPLRERPDDVPLLVRHFLGQLDAVDHPAATALCRTETLEELAGQPWPGNASALRRHIESCLATGVAPPLTADAGAALPAIDIHERLRDGRERWLRYYERQYLERVLQAADLNVARAARMAGVDRIHMYRLLRRAGIR